MAMAKNLAFVFPGQGAQTVGMGKQLANDNPDVADLYRRANDVLGFDLAAICFDGPEETLNSTVFSQPAIFVTSAACLNTLRAEKLLPEFAHAEPAYCAGLSLGEYTALYAAGAMSFEDALKLVQLRGQAMQQAAEQNPGSMVSLLGLDEPAAQKLCDDAIKQADGQNNILVPVNFNCPGQIVVSGTKAACQKAVELAEPAGAKAIPLRVAGAFHTAMMQPAADKLRLALEKTKFNAFKTPVTANTNALPYEGPAAVTQKLLDQLVQPVRWQQCVEFLFKQGVTDFVEIGPGRVLTGLIKKIARQHKANVNLFNASA